MAYSKTKLKSNGDKFHYWPFISARFISRTNHHHHYSRKLEQQTHTPIFCELTLQDTIVRTVNIPEKSNFGLSDLVLAFWWALFSELTALFGMTRYVTPTLVLAVRLLGKRLEFKTCIRNILRRLFGS
jgi:hypothetical protein